jgi:hypothetical protein
MGLHVWQLKDPHTLGAKSLLKDSVNWPWLRLQHRARRFLEKLFAGIESVKPPLVRVMPRGLLPARAYGGSIVLRWRPPLSRLEKPWDWVLFFLDDLLADLDGVSVDVVGRCRMCNHWFIRAAAGRKNYCSDTCRNRALYQRRKSKGEARQKRGKHRPESKSNSEGRTP